MNQPDTKEVELRQEIADDTAQLDAAIARVRQSGQDAKSELASLQSELPEVLFACAMGAGDDGRKGVIRSRIAELKADLADFPALYERFDVGRARIQAKQRQVSMLTKHRQRYEESKQFLTDNPREIGIATIDDIRSLAKHLDCEQDATSFLESLKGATAA